MKLKREFYNRETVKVAKSLIGKFLVRKIDRKIYAAEITETEAYAGFDDKASHAARGKTKRNEIMFGRAGFAYVYLIYGMYYCLNIVTEKKGYPSAVLIRGLDGEGLDGSASARRPSLDGPGKLCREFKITKAQNGLDMTGDVLWVEDRGLERKVVALKRVGVDYAGECKNWLWRFKRKI